MLSGIIKAKKTNIVGFHLDDVPRVVTFIETESRMAIFKWGLRGFVLINREFQFNVMKRVLQIGCSVT